MSRDRCSTAPRRHGGCRSRPRAGPLSTWWACSWPEPGDAARAATDPPSRAAGFPTREELADRYAARSGRNLDDLSYWMAFNAWRSSCIVQGVYHRYITGKMAARGDEDIDRFEQ